MPKVSVLIAARQEPYAKATVEDVFRQAAGDVEVVLVLDGWWPADLPKDPRLKILHWGEAKGLRPSLNAAVQIAKGDYLFKLDAHCALMPGFDELLAAQCEDGDIVVPAKYSLDVGTPEQPKWDRFRSPWHYFYVTWPWDPALPCVGLQDKNYDSNYNAPREHLRVDDILSYQGSAWMLRRSHWDRLGPMDAKHYYYAQEPQELGFKTWLSGGRVKIVKDVWYAHLWKGNGPNKRQFKRLRNHWDTAMAWSCRHWMLDQEPGMIHPFAWLVEKFGPLPGWPVDWQAEAARRLT